VSKQGGQMLMFADKVGEWGWPNADVSKKYIYPWKNFSLIQVNDFFSRKNTRISQVCTWGYYRFLG
jgi:hypothetical protein